MEIQMVLRQVAERDDIEGRAIDAVQRKRVT
jgi:hypothetical protein